MCCTILVFFQAISPPAARGVWHHISVLLALAIEWLIDDCFLYSAIFYFLYSAILCSAADSLHFCRMWFWMSDCNLLQRILEYCSLLQCILEYSLKCCLVVTWLVPHETAAILARSVYTIQPCTTSHHFMQSHIHMVQACLAVTCHLLAK